MGRWGLRIPKAQKSNFLNRYHVPHKELEKLPPVIYTCSIDVGRVNLSVRLKKKHQDGRYFVLLVDLINLGSDKILPIEYRVNLNRYLLSRIMYFELCNFFFVEDQLPDAPKNREIQSHITGFLINLMMEKGIPGRIYDISPSLKGAVFEVPATAKGAKDKALKRWSVCQAVVLGLHRGEEHFFGLLVANKWQSLVRKLVLEEHFSGNDLFEYLEYARTSKSTKSQQRFLKQAVVDEGYVDFRRAGKGDDISDCEIQESAACVQFGYHYDTKCVGETYVENSPFFEDPEFPEVEEDDPWE